VRGLVALIYGALTLGALTMVYPFAIMIGGSMRSAVDMKDWDLLPRFLYDDTALYRKHIEGLFNESADLLNSTYDMDVIAFDRLEPPTNINLRLLAEWNSFTESATLPDYADGCGYIHAPLSKTIPRTLREFREELAQRFGGDIQALNTALGCNFVNWNSFMVLPQNTLLRLGQPSQDAFAAAFADFKRRQPAGNRYYYSVEGAFKRLFLKPQYTRDIAEYNRAHSTTHAIYDLIRLTPTLPAGSELERADWEDFVRHTLNPLWIRVRRPAESEFRGFLHAKYRNIDNLNRDYSASFRSFNDVPIYDAPPRAGLPASDWLTFIAGWTDPDSGRTYQAPRETLAIQSVETLFREFLEKRHGDIHTLNHRLGTDYTDFAAIRLPQREAHYVWFREHRGAIRREFIMRNYRTVLDYLLFNSRGVWNTTVYCALAVLFALLVNPLAAYALSRYRLPATYKILLFLMLTMAFPPMVTQIPVFIMLREFGLLNTFAALLLPGLANGYSIFLLKGFFDSLPRDLYENAQLDGAGEWTMFWSITMRLSTPILSVIALQAFAVAYTNFMFALLICQDERMWTLMVWLYELQQRSGQAVMYASLIIASVPTLIIFVLCQRIILRGIVVPVEK